MGSSFTEIFSFATTRRDLRDRNGIGNHSSYLLHPDKSSGIKKALFTAPEGVSNLVRQNNAKWSTVKLINGTRAFNWGEFENVCPERDGNPRSFNATEKSEVIPLKRSPGNRSFSDCNRRGHLRDAVLLVNRLNVKRILLKTKRCSVMRTPRTLPKPRLLLMSAKNTCHFLME